jgi:hypothetical protein
MTERLSERWDRRVEKGGRREVERRRLLRNYFGEGGKELTRQEQHQLFESMANDPKGTGMTDVLIRRQAANKLEGTVHIPADFWEWAVRESERMLGHKLGEA